MTERELIEQELAWAREVLKPYRDIPLTPEQERSLSLWSDDSPANVA